MSKGFLVIADLSGFTSFLSHSELEPAAKHLQTLLSILIENTRPPLIVSNLEGDAVLSYALEGTFLRGQTLVEMIEITYVAFRQALDRLVMNTHCDCNACQFIPDLDLKFFVHYGSFLLQHLSKEHVELVGSDVNLIHRLTKNLIKEKTGRTAYVAYTEQAIHHLEIEGFASQMPSITETYDHIGEILVFVQDMHEVWELRQSDIVYEVTETETIARIEALFPIEQVLLWDYVTLPDHRLLLFGSESVKVDEQENGRIGIGSTYHCVDDRKSSLQTICSWSPPERYTYETDRPFGTRGRITIRLEPFGNQTRMIVLVGKCFGKRGFMLLALNPLYRQWINMKVNVGLAKLKEKVVTESAPINLSLYVAGIY